jgi:hypothetical protein
MGATGGPFPGVGGEHQQVIAARGFRRTGFVKPIASDVHDLPGDGRTGQHQGQLLIHAQPGGETVKVHGLMGDDAFGQEFKVVHGVLVFWCFGFLVFWFFGVLVFLMMDGLEKKVRATARTDEINNFSLR